MGQNRPLTLNSVCIGPRQKRMCLGLKMGKLRPFLNWKDGYDLTEGKMDIFLFLAKFTLLISQFPISTMKNCGLPCHKSLWAMLAKNCLWAIILKPEPAEAYPIHWEAGQVGWVEINGFCRCQTHDNTVFLWLGPTGLFSYRKIARNTCERQASLIIKV